MGYVINCDSCGKKESTVVVIDPQPSTNNNDTPSISMTPLKIVGPVGLIAIVLAIYFGWLFTRCQNQQVCSGTQASPNPGEDITVDGHINTQSA